MSVLFLPHLLCISCVGKSDMAGGRSMGIPSMSRMVVARVAVALTLASSATTGLDPDRREDIPSLRPLILAHIVSGSEGGLADGIYLCTDPVGHSVVTCAHLRDPLLRLERNETRQTIFSGVNPIYQATINQTGGTVAMREGEGEGEGEEDWVWLYAANTPPRGAPSLAVLTVRDTGCLDDVHDYHKKSRLDENGAVFDETTNLEMQQLGDVYHRAGRFSEAEACYTGALRAGQPPPDLQQRCHLRLALCTVSAAEGARKARTRGGGGGNQLSSARQQQQREETECFAGLLLDEEGGCSEAVDQIVREAHITVGVFRLCEEWNVEGALHHFLRATANAHREGGLLLEEQQEEGQRVPQGYDVGWGAVWLAQAIQGRTYEASAGFTAKAAEFGEAWARARLQTWRRRLGRSCSGIGMGGVVEGVERLVIAGVRTATEQGGGADDIDGEFFTQAEIVDFHLTLSRTLLLLGASQEADGHARAAEQLSTTRNITTTAGYGSAGEGTAGSSDGGTFRGQRDDDNGDAAALRLEIELLSRTPVVLETVESASSLRRSLFAALKGSSKAETGFSGSIPNPLDVGLRTQFLATYQGLNDKAVATALTVAFDKASGGTLSYCSPHLFREKDPYNSPSFGGNHDTRTSKRDSAKEREPSWPGREPPTAASTATSRPRPHEGSKTAATPATCDESQKCVRVGFLSSHFRWHSVGRLTVGLLERLSNSCSLEIIAIDASTDDGWSSTAGQSGPALQDTSGEEEGGGDVVENPITKRLDAAGVSLVRLPSAAEGATADLGNPGGVTAATAKSRNSGGTGNNALQNARKTVAALKLDVLVYGDVGMDALTTGLANGRLSPVQVAFWGHPGTTGLPAMDYFITSDLFEGELGRGSFLGAHAKGPGMKYVIENVDVVPDEAGAEDRAAEAVDGGSNAHPLDVAETASARQDAFSEQLVRLDGLGVLFDDPTRTFGWDPHCGDSNGLSGAGALSRSRSTDGIREQVPMERATGEPRQHHSDDCASELGPPSPRERGGGGSGGASSAREGRKKCAAATTNRPRLYVCAQSLMKMHPAFDAVLAGVLAADPLAHVLLLRDPRQLLWHSRFRRRLRAAIDAAEQRQAGGRSALDAVNATSDADDPSSPLSRQPGHFWGRVRFLSPLSGREFFRLQCRADVVLDPFPFGGGVTTLEALACGTPVVTAGALQSVHRLAEGMIAAAGDTKRQDAEDCHSSGSVDEAGGDDGGQSPGGGCATTGRCFTNANDDNDAGVLVGSLVARTTAEYVEKAVAVAAPGPLKERVRRALCSGRDGMLRGDGDSVATDWEIFLKSAAMSASSWVGETG